jgi:phosphoserine phosphatase
VAGAAVAAAGLAAGGATCAATSGGSEEQAGALAEALNAREGTNLTAEESRPP